MKDIVWKTKFSVYPFQFPNGVTGEIIVKDKGGIQLKLDLPQTQTIHFKNLEKAMIYLNEKMLPQYLN